MSRRRHTTEEIVNKLRQADGVPFRMLNIVDEFTRECLAIDVARKLGSDDVLERLSG